MIKRIIIYLLLITVILSTPVFAAIPTIHTEKQDLYHNIAEMARESGLPEEHELIALCKTLWWDEQLNLNVLAKTIKHEAGNCSWLHRIAVGQVVLNRVNSPLFPNTVYDVVGQTSTWKDKDGVKHTTWQYNPNYCKNFDDVEEQYYEDAKFVLDGLAVGEYVPDDIIWQAEFPQGKEIWWKSEIDTPYFHSTTYFCR